MPENAPGTPVAAVYVLTADPAPGQSAPASVVATTDAVIAAAWLLEHGPDPRHGPQAHYSADLGTWSQLSHAELLAHAFASTGRDFNGDPLTRLHSNPWTEQSDLERFQTIVHGQALWLDAHLPAPPEQRHWREAIATWQEAFAVPPVADAFTHLSRVQALRHPAPVPVAVTGVGRPGVDTAPFDANQWDALAREVPPRRPAPLPAADPHPFTRAPDTDRSAQGIAAMAVHWFQRAPLDLYALRTHDHLLARAYRARAVAAHDGSSTQLHESSAARIVRHQQVGNLAVRQWEILGRLAALADPPGARDSGPERGSQMAAAAAALEDTYPGWPQDRIHAALHRAPAPAPGLTHDSLEQPGAPARLGIAARKIAEIRQQNRAYQGNGNAGTDPDPVPPVPGAPQTASGYRHQVDTALGQLAEACAVRAAAPAAAEPAGRDATDLALIATLSSVDLDTWALTSLHRKASFIAEVHAARTGSAPQQAPGTADPSPIATVLPLRRRTPAPGRPTPEPTSPGRRR